MPLFITTVRWIALLLLGGCALYFNYNGKLREKAASLIVQAEETYKDVTKAGGLKFSWVVDSLYAMVPLFLRPLITRAFIEILVQSVFDSVQEYAKLQLDRLFNNTLEQ